MSHLPYVLRLFILNLSKQVKFRRKLFTLQCIFTPLLTLPFIQLMTLNIIRDKARKEITAKHMVSVT